MPVQKFSNQIILNDAFWAAEPINFTNTISGGVLFDASTVLAVDAVRLTANAAAAAATSIPLATAIAKGDFIPSGTVLIFTGSKIATLTADAKEGDTALTVSALGAAIAAADTATYAGVGVKALYGGTIIGRTAADRATGSFKPALDTHDDLGINAFDNFNLALRPEAILLRQGTMVYRAGLKGYAGLNATSKAKLEVMFQMID